MWTAQCRAQNAFAGVLGACVVLFNLLALLHLRLRPGGEPVHRQFPLYERDELESVPLQPG